MIKVIIAISGLGLADLMDGSSPTDAITIHFPTTTGFTVPGAADELQNKFVFDNHVVHAVRPKRLGPPEVLDSVDAGGNLVPFQLTVTVPSVDGATNDLAAANSFPNFSVLFGGRDPVIRGQCKFTATSLDDCVAKKKNGDPDTKLLAAQVSLVGNTWTLTAADTEAMGNSSKPNPRAPIVRFRTAMLDPGQSITHPYPGVRLANTLVFTAMVDQLSDVKIKRNNDPATIGELAPTDFCLAYDPTAPDCIVIRIDSHRTCPALGCPLPNWAQDNADTHFLQLYRLLDKYDPTNNTLDLSPMMPFPVMTDPTTGGPPGGGSSPRCYPAVRS